MSLQDIEKRVNASMCVTYGSEHPDGREEARISKDDWEAVLSLLWRPSTALWLVAEGDKAVVKAERAKGDWVTLIEESIDGPFSHIIEPAGIERAFNETRVAATP
jgi:hypothetical protein